MTDAGTKLSPRCAACGHAKANHNILGQPCHLVNMAEGCCQLGLCGCMLFTEPERQQARKPERTYCPLCDKESGVKYGGMGFKRETCEWHLGYAAGYEDGRWHGFEVGSKT